MSNAIAQSTSAVTISPNGEESFDFVACAQRAAQRSARGVTRESQMLNYNKLLSAVCQEYKMHFPAIYSKTDKLPSDILSKVEDAVSAVIDSKLREVNMTNVINYRRAFHHNSKEMEITERVTITGENKLTLKEQLFGVNMYISSAEKRLRDLEAKPTPDYDREKAVKQRIMQLTITKQYIEGEMKRQSELTQ